MIKNKAFRRIAYCFGVFFCIAILVSCKSSVLPVNVNSKGIAIKGFDAVAYFSMGKPIKGTEEYEYEWKGAKWWFASNDHRELFLNAPEKYTPQYGGY